MSVKFKATPKKNPRDLNATPKFYPTVVSDGEYTLKELSERIAEMSTVSRPDTLAALQSLVLILPKVLAQGKIVRLGDLGSLRLVIKGEGADDEKKLQSSSITSIKIIFTPGKEIKEALLTIVFEKI